ncbi:MAG TPA: hypothetical protein VFA18_23475 [Gemmataceae bacterium]|nr:hypothetical protein [Gemmataceae bacterium]
MNAAPADGLSKDNAEEIRRIGRKRARTRAWFFGWLLAIPLTPVLGIGLARLQTEKVFDSPFILIAVLGPFVALGGLILMSSDRKRYRRSYQLACLADQEGWRFLQWPALPGVPDLLVCRKSFLSKLGEAIGLGGRALAVANQAKFNRVYAVYADADSGALAKLTPELIDLCVRERWLALEVHDHSLAVYWSETSIKPKALLDRLGVAKRVLGLLRGET